MYQLKTDDSTSFLKQSAVPGEDTGRELMEMYVLGGKADEVSMGDTQPPLLIGPIYRYNQLDLECHIADSDALGRPIRSAINISNSSLWG